jgi:lysyl oxidase
MRELDHAQMRDRRASGAKTSAVKRLVALVTAFSLAVMLLLLGGITRSAGAQDSALLLPDLRMGPIQELKIRKPPDGRRLLRFSTLLVNVGAGPFEAHGQRFSTDDDDMLVTQRVYDDAGGYHDVPTTATMFFSGDGHDHWHIRDLQRYTLKRQGSSQQGREGAKEGFCVYDLVPYNLTLPGAPEKKHYTKGTTCGEDEEENSLRAEMGLSVGWTDKYAYLLPYQWIDITGLRSGTYRLRAKVDVKEQFTESREANNRTWSIIELKGDRVKVLKEGPAPRYCGGGGSC